MKVKGRRELSELEQIQAAKRKRIEAMYSSQQVDKILLTEKQWESLKVEGREDDLLLSDPSFDLVHRLIKGKARGWGRAYKNNRLTVEDFESCFYETVWLTIGNYSWTSEFYLYETIKIAIESRGKMILRKYLQTDRRRAFHEALPLIDGFEQFYPDKRAPDIAAVVVDRLVFEQQVLRDPKLTTSERITLSVLCDGGSQRDAARALNTNRRKISTAVCRIRSKLEPYTV